MKHQCNLCHFSDDDEEEIHPLDVNSSDGEEYDEEFSDEQSGRDDFESGDDESFEDEVNKTNDAMASDLEDAGEKKVMETR